MTTPLSPTSALSLTTNPWQSQQAYLTDRRNAGATPDVITNELISRGWDADTAASTALRSLRKTDQHRLLYWGLTWSAGLGALGLASSLHLVIDGNPSPITLACWLTLAILAIPVALLTERFTNRLEDTDKFAIWSPTRRTLFGTLAGVTAVIGLGRLFSYVFRAVAALVGVEGYEFSDGALLQVILSLGISAPLFTWALIEWRRSNVLVRGLRTGEAGDGAGEAVDGEGTGSAPSGRN